MVQQNDKVGYLNHFKEIYQSFLKKDKLTIETTFRDYVIDFDEWIVNANGTGFATIWVQPAQKVIYPPKFQCPIQEIEIEGLQLIIKTNLASDKAHGEIVSFEMAGHFNPERWHGRNLLDLQPIGKTVTTGYNRVIIEQDKLFSNDHIKHVAQNFNRFFEKTMNHYFGA